jgi:hypothetical protein
VKKLCSDEGCEEIIIPSGGFAAEAQGIFTGGSSDQVEGHVLDGDEVGWSVIGADTAFIVAEHHIQVVLNDDSGFEIRRDFLEAIDRSQCRRAVGV